MPPFQSKLPDGLVLYTPKTAHEAQPYGTVFFVGTLGAFNRIKVFGDHVVKNPHCCFNGFGKSLGTINTPAGFGTNRQVQFALKLLF